ncbi:ATP-dependent RecD-like DNA helicase [Acetivibrio sp. MSJd-27]|uniref:SF1B family DNA helicase RecD2 n=1 Tax=Acetivibrio sp. MSJd-27 TaxID=2841523 RepID=UPI001C0F88BC|nr:ATP-dependent RecD-like DNA helicase [Acetivibrio sp. MSJd-27]MBU5450874.1 ATP-dependent RecD-like DNA helicase [Acetivibrio sp. MSJd-27]
MQDGTYEVYEGTVDEIIYQNEENGYTVMEFYTREKDITVVGFFSYIFEGDNLKLSGNFVTHKEYGEQFKCEYYERIMPRSKEEVLRFLGSGLIKGVGLATAKKIVDQFGEDTLEIIEFQSERLSEIKGISYLKAIEIGESFREKKGIQSVLMFLQKYDISTNIAIKVYRSLGSKAITMIEENPYILFETVEGIGFKLADNIAAKMGIMGTDIRRMKAGIVYTLHMQAMNGHTCLKEEDLVAEAARILEGEQQQVLNALVSLLTAKQLVQEEIDGENFFFLPLYHQAEQMIAYKLMVLSNEKEKSMYSEDGIQMVEKENHIRLEEKQKSAIKTALENNVTIITGGPGTGKTTIIKSIINIAQLEGKKIALTAPTGRAAKRMAELCGKEAKTIHRLLEVSYLGNSSEDRFAKNETNPIRADFIIVDEMSMVDTLLMNALLKAVKIGTRLILVGDVDQLPSVGAGNILNDMIHSGWFACVKLTEVFRQEKESMIVHNAHSILKGEYPVANTKETDFFILKRYSTNQVINEIVSLCQNRIQNYLKVDAKDAIQVLSPMKKTYLGTWNLNKVLQDVLNPVEKGKKQMKRGERIFREGDKVMQMKNNYDVPWKMQNGEVGIGVFNGDTGVISEIDTNDEMIEVEFYDGRLVKYETNRLEELELAYAITVHKSQGSEFDAVIMPVFSGPPTLMYRNLLYTAITRAKTLVILIGNESCIQYMVENDRETKRYTGLYHQLMKLSKAL